MQTESSGFSLPSLLIALCLLVGLAGLTLTGTQRWLDNRQARADRASFAALLEYARMAAIITGKHHLVCAATASHFANHQGRAGDAISECGHDWAAGALLLRQGETGKVIRRFYPAPRVHLQGPAMPLVFRADSKTHLLNATFTFRGAVPPHYLLILNRVGRVRFSQDANASIAPSGNAENPP